MQECGDARNIGKAYGETIFDTGSSKNLKNMKHFINVWKTHSNIQIWDQVHTNFSPECVGENTVYLLLDLQ